MEEPQSLRQVIRQGRLLDIYPVSIINPSQNHNRAHSHQQ
ncbi:hypothetical protein ES703_25135 [subsurface metagenome]